MPSTGQRRDGNTIMFVETSSWGDNDYTGILLAAAVVAPPAAALDNTILFFSSGASAVDVPPSPAASEDALRLAGYATSCR